MGEVYLGPRAGTDKRSRIRETTTGNSNQDWAQIQTALTRGRSAGGSRQRITGEGNEDGEELKKETQCRCGGNREEN